MSAFGVVIPELKLGDMRAMYFAHTLWKSRIPLEDRQKPSIVFV